MQDLTKKRILIVDDVGINRMILMTSLENDYDIITAENGMIAKHMIDKYKDSLSLILLDIVMPVLDGFGVLDYLESQSLLHKIPVMLITAETTERNVLKGIKMGADDILAKPFDPQIAKPRIANILELYGQKKTQQQEDRHGPKILVVGNDHRMPDEMQQKLKDLYALQFLRKADQAIELLSEENAADFILMLDLMDEEEECRKLIFCLDETSLLSRSRILMLIEGSVPEDLIDIVQKGLYDVVNWPFDSEVVLRRIHNISQLSID